jgi:hypothetical protein
VSIDAASLTIQEILSPVLMITATAVTIGGMLEQYTSINDRVRILNRERLALALHEPLEPLDRERVAEIDAQVPLLLRRHALVHNAILTAYVAVALFVSSMFVIAAGAMLHNGPVSTSAVFVFLTGTVAFLVGLLIIAGEVRISRDALVFEAGRVLALPAPHDSHT